MDFSAVPPLALAGAIATIVFTQAMLVAEWKGSFLGRCLTKPVAAAGFVLTAVALGALDHDYGRWVFAALVLSLFGDLFLIPKSGPWFLFGLIAFLLGHVAFAVAFGVRGIAWRYALGALAVLAVNAGIVASWLLPKVPPKMKAPVVAYVAVISAMVAMAAGTAFAHPSSMILIAALMFYASDLAVARERFVKPGFSNKMWGLPLYFGGQMLFAFTVATAKVPGA